MQRLAEQVDHDEELAGISFDEFRDFCLFLNNLDDFQIAMRMYTLADKAIAPGKRNVHSNINLKQVKPSFTNYQPRGVSQKKLKKI